MRLDVAIMKPMRAWPILLVACACGARSELDAPAPSEAGAPIACPAGFADCDGDPSVCETETDADPNDCGACGVVCPAGLSCGEGTCRPGTEVVQVGVGHGYSCARRADGLVKCWGANDAGQLGNGTTQSSLTPVPVTGVTDAAQLVVSGRAACARLRSGRAACWGDDQAGLVSGKVQHLLLPVALSKAPAGLAFLAIDSAELVIFCAITTSGQVYCGGDNAFGALGSGNTKPQPEAVHVAVPAPSTVATDLERSCAVTATHDLWCWGGIAAFDLGVPAYPGPIASEIEQVTLDQAVFLVGVDRTLRYVGPAPDLPMPSTPLTNVVQFKGGPDTGCVRLLSGDVTCWGSNCAPLTIPPSPPRYRGLLGIGTFDCIEATSDPLTNVTGLHDAVDLAFSDEHICALDAIGNVACWGWNDSGQLGDGTTTPRAAPVLVQGM